MSQVENFLKQQLELLKSEDSLMRSSAAEALMNEEINDEVAEALCQLVMDPDKGVRNTADLVLSSNPYPKIPAYLVRYVSAKDISVRNLAGEILLKIGSAAVEAMLDYIDVGNDDDKKFIVDILGLIGDSKANDKILSLLKVNKNDNVILACIEALGNLRCEEAVDYIEQLYFSNELYKPTIIESLGKIGSKKAVKFITDNFKNEDDLTKFSMIESLGLIGNEETFFFLLSELNNLEGPLVWTIINSIYELKEKYHFDIPFDEKMKKSILNTIYEAEIDYQIPAVNLVLAFDDEEVINACLSVYGKNFELDEIIKPKIIEKPLFTLTAIPNLLNQNPFNLRNLLELLKDMIVFECLQCKNLLSNLQMRNLTDAISKCLDDSDEEARKLALELLFLLDESFAVLFLDKMVEDNNMWNRLKLLEMLENVRMPEADLALHKLAEDREEMISERAQFVISQRGNSGNYDPLSSQNGMNQFETKIED
jgi:HEAT repeat protein